nr:hypothetical protein [Tanacetum cinerariifolium]
MVPATVLTRSKPVSITAVRPVSTAVPKTSVTRPKQVKPIVTKQNSPKRRHITHSPSPKASNSPSRVTVVKASVGNPQHALNDKGVIDSRCSRHMIGNMSYLSDFEELNSGYVGFGGNPKGVIRSNNGTEFKNNDLNQLCGMKGIKREFSVPRTPQQNGIAKRKNRTLIEAARTMLASSLLPIPFWAEAVNTTCYVQNRVLVTKPYNKTPYELLHGRTPSIGFMRPFGCPLTILNTLDSLSKFDGKTLHVNFLKNKPNVASSGPAWLFDIDSLTKTMNCQLVTIDNQSNPSAEHYGDAAFDGKEFEFDEKKPESEVNVSLSRSAQSKKQDDKTKRKAKVKIFTVGQLSPNSTNTFSAAGPSNAAASPKYGKSSFIDASQLPDDPDMPELEDITYSKDEDDVGIKKDERGIVVRNKARLVAQGHTQDEGIHYKEVFSPVVRIEAIKLFLAYASFIGFMVYQIDVKSAFLYGTIEEEVYVYQPLGFEDPDHPDKVYKVVKALYSLHQAPRAYRKSASTPIDIEKPLLKDPDGEDVDVHTYISMIGSLMYLTSSRPDIMFVVCACARFQVTPKASHLYAVKRIFRYLKGKPHLGLWYLKDSPFDLVVYSDSDYVVLSSMESLKRMLRVTNILSAGSLTTQQMVFNSPCLTHIKNWLVQIKRSLVNDVMRLQALVDKKKVVVTEATIREALHLDDAEGVEKPSTKLIFYKRVGKGFSRVDTPMFEGMLVEQEVADEGDANENDENINAGDTAEGDVIAAHAEVLTGRRIAEMDQDADVVLEEAKEVAEDAKVDESIDIQGRQAESQAEIYKIDLEHANKVLSMQDHKTEPTEVQENVAGFKMDNFKGMSYNDIRPIFEVKFNSNVAFLLKTKEHIEEEESRALKRLNETPSKRAAKRKKKLPHLLKREDLEALWSLVKERFTDTKPNNFSDDFLLVTLGVMIEKPDIHSQVWKNQRSVHGPAKVKGWKLLESCGV